MRERRRVVAGLVAAAVAAVAAATATATAATTLPDAVGAARSCGPAAARTLARNTVARLYAPDRSSGLLASVRVYGCTFASSRIISLGGGARQQYVRLPTLGGRFAGYGLRQMGVDTGFTRVRVVDLRSGRVVDDSAATTQVTRPESFTSVASLVLNAGGHIAWIGSKSSIGMPQAIYEVHKIDAAGAAVLDAGPQIEPMSLRRHGSRISWKRAGTSRTASLN